MISLKLVLRSLKGLNSRSKFNVIRQYTINPLAQPKAGLCSACVSYFLRFVKPNISTATGPIFAKLAGLVQLWRHDLNLFFSTLKYVAISTIFFLGCSHIIMFVTACISPKWHDLSVVAMNDVVFGLSNDTEFMSSTDHNC